MERFDVQKDELDLQKVEYDLQKSEFGVQNLYCLTFDLNNQAITL